MRNLEKDLSDILQNSIHEPPFSFEEIWSKYEKRPVAKCRKSKRWWIGIIIPSIVVFSGVTALAASVLANYTDNLRTASYAQGIFEYVNGVPVTNEKFQIYKIGQDLVAQMNHQSIPSKSEVIHQFNLQQVTFQEAEKEHLVVTDKQAINFSLQTQQTIEHPPTIANKASFAQIAQIIKAEEKGLGVTDKQYWTKVAPEAYKVGLSIGNLKKQFITSYELSHPSGSFQTAQNAWLNYENQLLNNAKIKQVSK